MRIARGFFLAVVFSIFALTVHEAPCAWSALPTLRPSNSDTAFRQVPLIAPAGSGYALNAGHAGWPLSLENSALVRAVGSGAGDSVLIASSRLHGVSINLDGSVTYTLPPNTRANRIAAIVTANNGTDPFDYNFPLLFVSATFSDGRHWGVSTFDGNEIWTTKDLAFGHDVRNWSNQVAPSTPLFVVPPPAPTTFQLYAGPSITGPDSVFYDLQVVNLPDTLRNTSLNTITFSSVSVFTTTTATISGLVVWPQFAIVNRAGAAIITGA